MLDGEASGSGVFYPDAKDPETASAIASHLWELYELRVCVCEFFYCFSLPFLFLFGGGRMGEGEGGGDVVGMCGGGVDSWYDEAFVVYENQHAWSHVRSAYSSHPLATRPYGRGIDLPHPFLVRFVSPPSLSPRAHTHTVTQVPSYHAANSHDVMSLLRPSPTCRDTRTPLCACLPRK